MNFKEKYTTTSEKAADPEKNADKKAISEEAFALGELIEKLIITIERLSHKW